MAQGLIAIALHAHLPFVRHPEHETFLEEDWLYHAIYDCYLPLLIGLERLVDDGIPFQLTLSISPTLAAMLSDELLCGRARRHLERLSQLVDAELHRTRNAPELHQVACHYRQRLDACIDRWDGSRGRLLPAFSALADHGAIELATTCATHAYLPLWQGHPGTLRAQVAVAIREHERHFGRAPRGFWLPECGYFPGIDVLLSEFGIRYFFVENHGLRMASPRPRYRTYAPVYCPESGVAAFARDEQASAEVWSRDVGYPGDLDYREHHRDIGWDLPLEHLSPLVPAGGDRRATGLKYHRVTGPTPDKGLYDPGRASARAAEHARDFIEKRERQIRYLCSKMPRIPIVVAPYDAELFGHWWYEGPEWLMAVARRIAADDSVVALSTPSHYLDRMPTQQVAQPASSSWGENGHHGVWLSEENAWIYPHAHRAADEMASLARRYSALPPDPLLERALRQVGRELLLAQSSDWPFMLHVGRTPDYARTRVESHLRRFRHLAHQIESGTLDEAWLERLEKTDNVFPDLDWRLFA